MMEGVDKSFGAVVFVGYHAKAGTPNAILEHTSTGNVVDFSINGVSLPEAGYNALVAGLYDVPVVFAGKGLASLAVLLALELVLVPLTLIFFDATDTVSLGALALVLLLHTVGLAELGTLFGAVASRLGRGEALLAILLLPAATPLLLSAVQCTKGALAGDPLSENARWMLVTAGCDVLYFLVALLVFESVLEEG